MIIMTEMTLVFSPIVRHKKTSIPYEYLGENKFRNLVTLKEGFVPDEKARENFVINVEASQIINDYPIIKNLIHLLNLKLDVVDNKTQDNGGTVAS